MPRTFGHLKWHLPICFDLLPWILLNIVVSTEANR